MSLLMSCKAKCIGIKKKSKAVGFSHLQVGDVMEFRVRLDGVGQRSAISSPFQFEKCVDDDYGVFYDWKEI